MFSNLKYNQDNPVPRNRTPETVWQLSPCAKNSFALGKGAITKMESFVAQQQPDFDFVHQQLPLRSLQILKRYFTKGDESALLLFTPSFQL
jgi:hypothetical protein